MISGCVAFSSSTKNKTKTRIAPENRTVKIKVNENMKTISNFAALSVTNQSQQKSVSLNNSSIIKECDLKKSLNNNYLNNLKKQYLKNKRSRMHPTTIDI